MAISVSTAMQAILDDPHANLALLYTFEFATTYGLWTGQGEIPHNGLWFRAGGSVIDPGTPSQSVDGSVGRMTLSLSTATHKDITDDFLGRLLINEDWHMKRITMQLATVDPAFSTILETTNLFRGRIEDVSLEKGKTSKLVAKCASTSIDLSKSGGLYRNDASQKRFDPTDRSHEEIGTLNGALQRESKWGQA